MRETRKERRPVQGGEPCRVRCSKEAVRLGLAGEVAQGAGASRAGLVFLDRGLDEVGIVLVGQRAGAINWRWCGQGYRSANGRA